MSSILDIMLDSNYIDLNLWRLYNGKNYSQGSWIEIKSLNKVDKKKLSPFMSVFLIGALFWGVHLTSVERFFSNAI